MPIESHEYVIPIEPDAILWRYMNFKKFLSLLTTKSLFFCRADKFPDPFEGTYPRKEVEYRPENYRQICNFYNIPFDLDKCNKHIDEIVDFNKRTRMATVINSWHINTHESDNMWRLYLKTDEGVAIQTKPQRLLNSLQETQESIYPSKIRYIDYDNCIWYHETDYPIKSENSLKPFLHKRIEFTSENEFRLFHIINDVIFYQGENYWDKEINHVGIFIKINLEQLIEKVILHPNINDQEHQKIESYAKDLGYYFNFQKSELSKNPYY